MHRSGAFVVVIMFGLVGMLSFRIPPLQFISGFFSQTLAPVEQFVRDPARQASDFVRTVDEIGQLRAENSRLHDEVDRLHGQATRANELERENADLREQINLKRDRPTLQWLQARVIGRDATNLVRSVAIDRGSADGISVGMTVITPAGLAGQVVRVGPHTARVLLITDVGSSVTAIIQGSRADGVVNGQGTGFLVMQFIPLPAVVKTGDVVITSGLGGIFPNGIPVGRVVSVSKKDVGLFQEARVEPEVDFSHIETLLVVTNHVPVKLD